MGALEDCWARECRRPERSPPNVHREAGKGQPFANFVFRLLKYSYSLCISASFDFRFWIFQNVA